LAAGSAGPDGGVNAVEITDAVHVVTPPRWSDTVTRPSGPVIVLAVVDAICDPSETLAVGALIESPPAVSVNEVGVSAPAGTASAEAAAQVTPTANKADFLKCLNTRSLHRGLDDREGEGVLQGRRRLFLHSMSTQIERNRVLETGDSTSRRCL
jgi:hypothetical protein